MLGPTGLQNPRHSQRFLKQVPRIYWVRGPKKPLKTRVLFKRFRGQHHKQDTRSGIRAPHNLRQHRSRKTALAVEARKLEYNCPPTPSLEKKDNQPISSQAHIPAFWSLYYRTILDCIMLDYIMLHIFHYLCPMVCCRRGTVPWLYHPRDFTRGASPLDSNLGLRQVPQ